VTTVIAGDGVPLAVYVEGTGDKTALLVHGYPDSHLVWDDVAPRLRDAGFRVVRYDVRGAGASGVPASRDGYLIDQLAEDLFSVIDSVGGPVHLVGHDWGSVQAWHAVTDPRAPELILSFTSISGPGIDHAAAWYRRRLSRPTPRHLRQAATQAARSWYIAAFQVPGAADAVVRRLFKSRAADAVHGLELYRANIRAPRRHPRLRTEVPVQVITPMRDRYVTPSFAADDVHHWAPSVRRHSLDAGHWSVLGPEAALLIRTFTAGSASSSTPLVQRRGPAIDAGDTPLPFASGGLVVVTGGGSGIGRATALEFARRGAAVVVCDLNLEAAEQAAALAGEDPDYAYQVDVSDEKAMNAFASEVVEVHGTPTIVVNNAGIGHAGTVLATTTGDWRRVLDVNLFGVIHGCRAFGPLLHKGGHIVNVASAAAFLPPKDMAAYATSKAAVVAMSDALRGELTGRGVNVSVICPGFVKTNITRTVTYSGLTESETQQQRDRATKLYARRNYPPEKVARAIVAAVERNKPLVAVTPEAKIFRAISRFAPRLGRFILRRDLA
jgi:NAD(P)-dependent dehydrogenase (short-subunit alcohol dehydrogenase family)/pimeloyl-ACP methyl ester carboxylesterase